MLPDFRFAPKAPRYATNRKLLAEAGDSIARFTEGGLAELGENLGPINWQLALTKPFERDDFARFFDLMPANSGGLALRHAVELKHDDFRDPAVARLSGARGVAIILADGSIFPKSRRPLRISAICGLWAPARIRRWAIRMP